MKFPLGWLLFNRWIWITILSLSLIAMGPFIVISILLALPSELKGVATILLIFGWGIAAGYKDWAIAKRQEEKIRFPTSEKYHE